MSISNTAELVIAAKREGFEAAAAIVRREADRMSRKAEREHKKLYRGYDDFNNELYEFFESGATMLYQVAGMIERKAKRR